MIDVGGYNVLIEVEGGIDTTHAAALVEAGVDVLVAGNAIFSSSDPSETISKLKKLN
jgi:ribulose-phosphate 3-epimerase